MRGSLRTKLRQLSPEQKALLESHRKRWAGIRLSTAPADREAAERGVGLAYRAAGYAPPRQIVWCDSPVEMAALWAGSTAERAGPNLKAAVVEQVRCRAAIAVQRLVTGSVLAAVDDSGQRAGSDTATETAREAVLKATSGIRPAGAEGRWWLFWLFWLNRGRSWLQIDDSGCSPRGFAWLERHDFFRSVCGFEEETEGLRGLLMIAENADWFIPHKQTCWVSEPPQVLKSDLRVRLHCEDGPALQYRDGWSVYAWKGVEVPPRVIEQADQISCSDIDRATDIHVRRCMIERLTPERYIACGAAYRVSEDETGILWERRWADGDAWAAVEVINGTPEPDGERRRYFLQVPPNMLTARSAVAWTYGMTARQYRGLILRT
ncbi:MAG: DUF6745 domain-containing protein [Rhodomicrobium sp.]